MNNQFSPRERPEVNSVANPNTKEASAPITGGVIHFHQVTPPTEIADPHAVINRGNVVSLEDYRNRALDAIGAPVPAEKAA